MFSFVGTRLMCMSKPSSSARVLGNSRANTTLRINTRMQNSPDTVDHRGVVERPGSAFAHAVFGYRVVAMDDDTSASQLRLESR